MRKNILFDLDSTLLQMDQDEFIRQYIYTLNLKIKEIGKDKEFINYFLKSVYCTIENNGDKTNEDLFWSLLDLKYPNSRQYEPFFDSFYKNEFRNISSIVDKNNTTKLLICKELFIDKIRPLHMKMQRSNFDICFINII